jgi:large subunit ribosomal protein L1
LIHGIGGAMTSVLQRSKPAAAKGRYLKRITISSTMSPGVRIDPSVVETA